MIAETAAAGWGTQIGAVIVALGALATAIARGRTANSKVRSTHQNVHDLEVRHDADLASLQNALLLTQQEAARNREHDRLECQRQLDELTAQIVAVKRDRANEIADVVIGRLAPLLQPPAPTTGEVPVVKPLN